LLGIREAERYGRFEGQTALSLAIERNNPLLVQALFYEPSGKLRAHASRLKSMVCIQKNGVDYTALAYAQQLGSPKILKILSESQID